MIYVCEDCGVVLAFPPELPESERRCRMVVAKHDGFNAYQCYARTRTERCGGRIREIATSDHEQLRALCAGEPEVDRGK